MNLSVDGDGLVLTGHPSGDSFPHRNDLADHFWGETLCRGDLKVACFLIDQHDRSPIGSQSLCGQSDSQTQLFVEIYGFKQ